MYSPSNFDNGKLSNKVERLEWQFFFFLNYKVSSFCYKMSHILMQYSENTEFCITNIGFSLVQTFPNNTKKKKKLDLSVI